MESRALQSLCAKGELKRAMELLYTLKEPPPPNAYVALLKACKQGRKDFLSHARQVYGHMADHSVPLSGLLGDYLVVTLSMCGDLEEAIRIHGELPARSVYSWTSLISSFAECGCAHAVECFELMLQDGFDGTVHTFLAVFNACGRMVDLNQGRIFHARTILKGLDNDSSIGNAVAATYAQCSSLADAEEVFSNLSERSQFAWNSMISLWVHEGQAHKAIKWYAYMKSDCVEPNHYTYIMLFKACEIIANLEQGCTLHSQASAEGYGSDGMVGSSLICMYGKLGAIGRAEEVFSNLPKHDIVTWNALLTVYVTQGLGRKALHLYRQMQQVGLGITERTCVIALRACATVAEQEDDPALGETASKFVSYHIGQALHADARKKGFLSAGFIRNTLLSMYGKCRAISDAEHVFLSLVDRDTVTCNAMLSAYVDLEVGPKALHLYYLMEMESIISDQATYVSALQAIALLEGEVAPLSEGRFSRKMSLDIGHAIHGTACRFSLASDVMVGSALVSMYSRCASITEAEHTFDTLTQHPIAAWNAMMSAYVEQGDGGKALWLFAQMHVDGYIADQITFILALQACGTLLAKDGLVFDETLSNKEVSLFLVQAIHADISRGSFAHDISVSNALVSVYGKCGAIVEAENVFFQSSERTVVSWNAMLSAYAEHNQCKKALLLYRQMQKECVRPDLLTFLSVLQACIAFVDEKNVLEDEQQERKIPLKIGQALHLDCKTKGFISHASISSSLLRMYGKCGAVMEAEDLCFTFLSASADSALLSQGIITCNLMLSAYSENGLGSKTIEFYRIMQGLGIPMTVVSITRTLQASTLLGSQDICQELHFGSVLAGVDCAFYVATMLVHAYSSCASMIDADASLQALSMLDVVPWNACIEGHAGVGDSLQSFCLFEQLKFASALPSLSTFISVLSACTQTGLISGLLYFESMARDFCLEPETKHYCILADLYGRMGDLKKVELVLADKMARSNCVACLCVLGACRTHSNFVMAKQAYDQAMTLQQNLPVAYVLMSNTYADIKG